MKDALMTKLGWPVPQPRLTRRPSGQHDQPLAVGEHDFVDLGLDVVPFVVAKGGNLNLGIEVPDIADDRAVFHLAHVIQRDDVLVSGCGHEDISPWGRLRPW